MAALITATGDNSNLILDPDLDSFYVMDSLVVQLPSTLVAAAEAATGPEQSRAEANVADQAVLAGGLARRRRGGLGRGHSRAEHGPVRT